MDQTCCDRCGASAAANARFCRRCGSPVRGGGGGGAMMGAIGLIVLIVILLNALFFALA
jgi:hypothetical protein